MGDHRWLVASEGADSAQCDDRRARRVHREANVVGRLRVFKEGGCERPVRDSGGGWVKALALRV